jgi:Glycosyltransferase like family
MNPEICVVAAVNDETVLQRSLCSSPMIRNDSVQLVLERHHESASRAYNAGLDQTDAEIVVFSHQDVYLPDGWDQRLRNAIATLEEREPEWGVLGVFGVTAARAFVGQVWSMGLNKELCGTIDAPAGVVSLDELVLVMRNGLGMRFDDDLPGFHLYGTDLAQIALDAEFGAYCFHGPVIHNSRPVKRYDQGYREAHRYLCNKWEHRLPIPTCTAALDHKGALLAARLRLLKHRMRDGRMLSETRVVDPRNKAIELGYE